MLFRTLRPTEKSQSDPRRWDDRFWSGDVESPLSCRLEVVAEEGEKKGAPSENVLASSDFLRLHMSPGVTRREVKEGPVRGILFLPPKDDQQKRQQGDKKKSVILTLHGGIRRGKVCEDVAALLASR